MKRGGTRKKRGGTRKKRGGTRKKRGGMLKALQTTIVPYGLYKLNKYYQNKTRRNKRKSYRGGDKQSLRNLRIKRVNEKRKRAESAPKVLMSRPLMALQGETRKRAESIPVTKKDYKDLIGLGIGSRISNAIAHSNDDEFAVQVARQFQDIRSEIHADEIGMDSNTLQCKTKWDQKYPCSKPPPPPPLPPPPQDGGRKTRKRRRTRRKRRKKRTKRKRRKTKNKTNKEKMK